MLQQFYIHRQFILLQIIAFLFSQWITSPLVYADAEVNRHLFYDTSQINDGNIKTCITNAVQRINNETCILLREQPSESNTIFRHNKTSSIYFSQSDRGLCGVDADNSSLIYLNRECVTNDPNACIHLISKALTGRKAVTANVFSLLNEHFECNDHCQISCLNGGKLDFGKCDDCNCPFNGLFEGQTCDELVKLGEYTDEACKTLIVGTEEWNGELKLKAPINEKTYCQIMLVADDPWAKLEVEFASLDMSRRAFGAIDCPDRLYVYGLETAPMKSIKCNSVDDTKPREHFFSKSNFLLFQLEANRFDKKPRAGPIIRYTLRPAAYSAAIRTQRASIHSQNYADETIDNEIAEGSSDSSLGFLNGIGGTKIAVIAVVLACISAILVLAAFAAFGRRRRILRNRRYRHHQNNGSNGTSSSDKRRNSCASSVKSGEKVTTTNEIEEPPATNGVHTTNTTSTISGVSGGGGGVANL
ncbi:unnamed protein product [Meloidogyne enterolobii]|uniref:Uncharacterized protein n=1 Tax=Meloidogyne enterolobii TaxID=390850 RepID=A0ACB0ZKR2_MELEN